jgi:hypothetical protein
LGKRWSLFLLFLFFTLPPYTDMMIDLLHCWFIRKVQKSLAELEKLHSSGEGEHLFLPTTVGHNYQNKVSAYFNHKSFCIFCCMPNLHILMQVLKSQIFVENFSQSSRHTFLDYLTGGCELNFMVAIDFTGKCLLNWMFAATALFSLSVWIKLLVFQ